MNKTFALWGAAFAVSATVLGAFGAHTLKNIIGPKDLHAFETGIEYQFYHALALLLLSVLSAYIPGKLTRVAGYLFVTGIFLFSFSIYLLSTRGASGLAVGFLGPVTPLGGLCLISGWITLIIAILKKK